MAGRERQVIAGVVLGLVVALGLLALHAGDDEQRIGTAGAVLARAGVPSVVEPAPAAVEPATTSTTAAAPQTAPAPSTTAARPTTTLRATTTTAPPAPVAPTTTSTTAPAAAAAAVSTTTTTTTAPATTTTTVDPCRNSTDPKCGPFHFDPQPGADRPMTVEVTVEPAAPVAGQPLVFHVTLSDPDGVSYNGTTFNYGNGGVAGSTPNPCAKYGPWDPPAPDLASATETIDVGHTYFEAGTYTATFLFDAGPFDCTDSVTGRADRPYASSATGTVIFTVAAS